MYCIFLILIYKPILAQYEYSTDKIYTRTCIDVLIVLRLLSREMVNFAMGLLLDLAVEFSIITVATN